MEVDGEGGERQGRRGEPGKKVRDREEGEEESKRGGERERDRRKGREGDEEAHVVRRKDKYSNCQLVSGSHVSTYTYVCILDYSSLEFDRWQLLLN